MKTVDTPAQAMNWEGHDEGWMQDLEAGLVYEQALPNARPLPGRACPVTAAEAAANPRARSARLRAVERIAA